MNHSTYKLGIVCSHPIQYYSPIFREIARDTRVDLTVFYCHKPNPADQGHGFGVPFEWDTDLLSGYSYRWLSNRSKKPNANSFWGCDIPEIQSIVANEKWGGFLVLGWNRWSDWQTFGACLKNKIPIYVRADSREKNPRPTFKKWAKKIIYPFFMRQWTACFATGVLSADYFKTYGAKKVVLSPHSVDIDWFSKAAETARKERLAIRHTLGIPENARVALFCGKFDPGKAPDKIVQLFHEIYKESDNDKKLFLLMVGQGALFESVKSIVQKNQLPVGLTGFVNQSQMPKMYAVSDFLVFPSPGGETWGLVVNEAMASGLPAIVSSAVGCAPDLAFERSGVEVCAANHWDELKQKVKFYFETENLSQFSQWASSTAKLFSPVVSAKTILNVCLQRSYAE